MQSLEYNFRVRTSIDEMCFGKGTIEGNFTNDRFSLPPKPSTQEFSIIERPDIPELDNFIIKMKKNTPTSTAHMQDFP